MLSRYRIYWLCALVMAAMWIWAPKFGTLNNMIALLKGSATHMLAAIGFTLVLATGQLDLSFAACMTLGAATTIGMQPRLGWLGACCVGIGCGLAVGLANGLLVSKAKVNSFIVTLGTMTIVQGLVNIYTHGGSLDVADYRLGEWLDASLLWAPPIVFAVAMVLVFEFLLHRSVWGKNLLLTGGNPQTAWHAGLRTDALVIGAFALSGALSGLGGSIVAMKNGAAWPDLGMPSLMIVITAVIVGGTSMKGGKGSVVGSAVAVLTLTAISNGLGCLHLGEESRLIASGLVLAAVVLYDALVANRQELLRGQRPDLLAETARSGGDE